jgi:hypothetical protein
LLSPAVDDNEEAQAFLDAHESRNGQGSHLMKVHFTPDGKVTVGKVAVYVSTELTVSSIRRQVFAQAHVKYYNDIPCIRSVVFMWDPACAKIPSTINVPPKKEPWLSESDSTTSNP